MTTAKTKTKSRPKAKVSVKPKRKSVAKKVKKRVARGKDTAYNQPVKGDKVKSDSNIFPKEMAERMKGLVAKSGIDGLNRSFERLTISNAESKFAMPTRGDYHFTAPTPERVAKIKASFDKEQKRIIASKGDGLDIEASLKINAANTVTLTPFFHTPGNAQDAYNLPKSYVEQIRWSRLMFNLNPYIASVTELKAYYPVSKFKISTSEPWVTDFYETVAFSKRFNLVNFIRRVNLSKKKFGEAIMWGTRRQDGVWPQTGQPKWVWSNFIILEPELVEIKRDVIGDPIPKYFLRPNRDFEELVRRLEQNDPSVAHLQGTIAPAIIEKIKNRELIPLDPTTVSAIQVLTDGSAERGTPPYQRLFVNYTFEDFVRLALMSQAQRYHFPVELWTVGNLEKNIMPSVKDLEAFRDMVADAIKAPPFSMFFPPIVDYKALGVHGTLMDIKSDMEYAHKQYLIGLGVNENMILGESGIFSSNETAGNQTFIRLVQIDRDDLEEWMRWEFFEPLAQWNNLKVEKNGELHPIIPNIEWEKTLDFKAQEDEREQIKWGYGEGLIDPDTVIEVMLNRNPEEIKTRLRKAIGGILDNGKIGGAARKKIEGEEAEGAGGGGGGGGGGLPGGAGLPAGGEEGVGGGEGPGLAPSAEGAGGADTGPGLAPPAAGGGGAEQGSPPITE